VLAEFSKIVRLYLDRNVLDAGDLVGSHADFFLVVGLAVCIDKVVAVRPRNRVIILGSVLGVDNNALLEAAAMQTVVGRCAGNRIERALIVFVAAVGVTGPNIPLAAAQVNTLALPVFVIRNSGVSVSIGRRVVELKVGVAGCGNDKRFLLAVREQRFTIGLGILVNRAVLLDNRHRVLVGCGVFLVANLDRGDIFQEVRKVSIFRAACLFQSNRACVILRRRRARGNDEACRYVCIFAVRVGNRYRVGTRQSGTEFDFAVLMGHAIGNLDVLCEILGETGEGKRSFLCVCIELCNFGLCALCDVRNMQLFRQIELDYAVLGVVGDCADVLAYEGGVSAEAKLGYMPDFGYVVQTVGIAVRVGQDNGVNLLALRDFVAFDLHFVLGVMAGGLEFLNGCGILGRRTGRLAERPLAVGQGRFLVVRRGVSQGVVGVACAFKQRLLAVIDGGFILAFFVFYRDAYGVAVCYLLEAGKVARLYANRIGNAGNIRAVAIDMIRTACQRTVAGLILGRRRNRVNGRCIFAQFRLIELVIRNIHQHVAVIAAGRAAAAAGGRTAARRSCADGSGLAGVYGLVAGLDAGNAACRRYLGVLGRNRNVVRVRLYSGNRACAGNRSARRRNGDRTDRRAALHRESRLFRDNDVIDLAGNHEVGLRRYRADAAAGNRERSRAVRVADEHTLACGAVLEARLGRCAADDDAAGDLNAVERNLVRAVRNDEVAVDRDTRERSAVCADDQVAVYGLVRNAARIGVGRRHVGDDLGKFCAGDVVLRVQAAVCAVHVAVFDQCGKTAGRPRGNRAVIRKTGERSAAAVGQRESAGEYDKGFFTGDRVVRMEQTVRALKGFHLHGTAHVVVVPCVREHIAIILERGGLGRAERAGYDSRHLGAGQQALTVDFAVRAVQQAVIDRFFQRIGRPVVREVVEPAEISRKGARRQKHGTRQHQCECFLALHFLFLLFGVS